MHDEDVEVDDYEADESENDNNESSSVAVQTVVTFGLGLDIATPQELHTYIKKLLKSYNQCVCVCVCLFLSHR